MDRKTHSNKNLWAVDFRGKTYYVDFKILKNVYDRIGYNYKGITKDNIKERLRKDKFAYSEFYELISRYSVKKQGSVSVLEHFNN